MRRRTPVRATIIAIVILGLLRLPAVSLQTQIRTRVDLVVVPTTVRDNNGNLLTSLTQDDFSVFEDGKPQAISNFSMDAQPLSAAIVIDDAIRGAALNRVVSLFPLFLAGFRTDDEIALFRYDHVFWKILDFSSDTSLIQESFREIDDIAQSRPPDEDLDPSFDSRPKWLKGLVNILKAGGEPGTVGGPPPPIPSAVDRPKPVATSRVLHTAMYEAAMALRSRPKERRKVIFVISDGEVREPSKIYTLNKNIENLAQNEIQVFGISTTGALLEGPFGALQSYAAATGGDVYGGRSESDMKFVLGRIVDEARNEYVLGYISNNTPDDLGVVRNIVVKSGDPSQGRKVNHRKSYVQYPAR